MATKPAVGESLVPLVHAQEALVLALVGPLVGRVAHGHPPLELERHASLLTAAALGI